MNIDELEAKLRALGYDREDSFSSETNHKAVIGNDYSGKSLNHTISSWCSMKNTNFDYAAATGSMYTKCEFVDCSMNQTDFEFCSFHDCEFTSDKTVISSFNGCNFVKTRFVDIVFESCTFTGAFFEDCLFRNVKIINSTLENAMFQKCNFLDMDLRNLNMDYVHLEKPQMANVVLPFAQIPYMFGCLQYLKETQDEVKISSQNGGAISKMEYFDSALPLLIEYWASKSGLRPEFYFPLSNVHIAGQDFEKASESLTKGLQTAVSGYDYRMIKFYSKLISLSDLFGKSWAHQFYKWIHVFMPNANSNNPAVRSFMRNIGEIKAALFGSHKKPTLTVQMMSALHLNDYDNIGKVLGRLFSIAKMKNYICPNDVELVLSENSPLLITAKIVGEEETLIFLLPLLMRIANVGSDEIKRLAPATQESNTQTDLILADCDVLSLADSLITECNAIGAQLSLIEYYLENCELCDSLGITTHYCNLSGTSHVHGPNMGLLQLG